MRKRSLALLLALCALCAALSLSIPRAIHTAGLASAAPVPLPVLMYHHLNPRGTHGQDVISPQQFCEDLDALYDAGYRTVTLRQLADALDGIAPLPEKPLLITFDDGFESVYEYAWPALEERGMTAVLFVLTGQTDRYSDTPKALKHVSYSYATWDELREMAESGVIELGNHTHSLHNYASGRRMGILSYPGEAYDAYARIVGENIQTAQEKLYTHTGSAPLAFAYPFGYCDANSIRLLSEMGFRFAFTSENGVSLLEQETLLTLCRINRGDGLSAVALCQRIEKQRAHMLGK